MFRAYVPREFELRDLVLTRFCGSSVSPVLSNTEVAKIPFTGSKRGRIQSVCMQNDILLTERPLFRFPLWRQNPNLKARNGVPCTEFAATLSPEAQTLFLPPLTCT